MRVLSVFFVFFAVGFAAGAAAEQQPLSLEQCFRLALKQSETLKIDKEQIEAADARYRQVVSALYPGIELAVSERLREKAGGGSSSSSSGSGGTEDFSRSEPRTDRFQAGVRVTQLIFSGFRQNLLAKGAESEMESLELGLQRSRELLYQAVAEAYFQIVLGAEDIKLLAQTEKTLTARVGELRERTKLGKSRESEILSAEGDLYDIRAAAEQARGIQAAAREALAFLIGRPAADITLQGMGEEELLPALSVYLDGLAEKQRADIRAAEELVAAQEQFVAATKRQYWPRVELEGNIYAHQSPDVDGNYDVTLRMAMPLFDGWRIAGQVREQESILRTRRLRLQELTRRQEEEVRSAYARADAAQREAKLVAELLHVAEANLNSQRADYDLGIVNNLAVLDAIRQLTSTRRRLLVTRVSQRINQARLKVAAGTVENDDIG